MPHWLLLHVAVALTLPGQTLAHPPQFFGSVLVSTQLPPHKMYGWLQAKSHRPPLQSGVAFAGGIQTLSHMPQLAVLVIKSTHEPPQFALEPQLEPHWPAAQTSPPVQALAQSPQCAWSLFRSTHSPLQSV